MPLVGREPYGLPPHENRGPMPEQDSTPSGSNPSTSTPLADVPRMPDPRVREFTAHSIDGGLARLSLRGNAEEITEKLEAVGEGHRGTGPRAEGGDGVEPVGGVVR